MGLFDSLIKGAGDQLIIELQLLRKTLEIGIDSYRGIHGLPPKFAQAEPPAAPMTPAPGVIPSGDFQTYFVLEQLARENGIPLTVDLDLEALALERGWMSPEGQLLVEPKDLG